MPASPSRLLPASLQKRADDNDGQDSTYEKAMSDIADIVLQDRAPALKQYEVGFQLIDRDDDNEKAVGVKVFKVGKTWLYAPIFFLSGRVKGTELLYIKGQDIFVPLQEDWIRDILNKQTTPMGTSAPRNLAKMHASVPDLRQLIRPPTKFAAADDDARGWKEVFRKDVLPKWARALTSDPFAGLPLDLPGFLKDAGAPAVKALAELAEACPRIVIDLDRFHGPALLGAIKEAAAKPAPARPAAWRGEDLLERPDPVKAGALAVLTYDRLIGDDLLMSDIESDHDVDVRTQPLILDNRTGDQVSIPVEHDAIRQLTNPTETGLYEVLTAPLKYEKCLVCIAPATSNGNMQAATVVNVESKAYMSVHPSSIWVGRKYEDPEWSDFIDGLPSADSASASDDYDAATIFLAANGNCTAPVRIRREIGSSDGGTSFVVSFDVHREDCEPSRDAGSRQLHHPEPCEVTRDCNPVLHVGTARGSRIWSTEGNMYVPAKFKRLEVEHDPETIILGSPYHVTLDVVRKTRNLKVASVRGKMTVNDRAMTPYDALVHLVVDHGLRKEAAARIMLAASRAEDTFSPVVETRVKYADPYLSDTQPGSPGFPEPWMGMEQSLTDQIPSIPNQYELQRNLDLMPRPDALQQYDIRRPDPRVLQAVQQAAQSGSKEVFDTSMISGLLQTTQSDLQVDKYLGPLMAGLNAKGRILMNFYWHDDDFAERYGKDDLSSLEDMLRNTFINDGKLILNLKQKGVEDPLDIQHEMDLDQASEQ